MSKKCYSDNGKNWTGDGHVASDAFKNTLDPIFKKLVNEGYSPRELMGVALLAVHEVGLWSVLDLKEK